MAYDGVMRPKSIVPTRHFAIVGNDEATKAFRADGGGVVVLSTGGARLRHFVLTSQPPASAAPCRFAPNYTPSRGIDYSIHLESGSLTFKAIR